MVGVSVNHKIILILIIHILAKLTISSVPSFSETGISQVVTSIFLIIVNLSSVLSKLLLRAIIVHHQSINHIDWKSLLHYAALRIL